MDKLKIKQIESVGKKIGAREKPIVTDKNILFIAGFLSLNGYKTNRISDGLLSKNAFLAPCIVLEAKKKPKIRFKNQIELFERYLAQRKKKNIKQLSMEQYGELIDLGIKNGESEEYVVWRKEAASKTMWLKNLLDGYNKKRKEVDKKERLSVLEFNDGAIRLDFGNQTNQNLRKNIVSLSLAEKKKKLNLFLREFGILREYLISNFSI